MSLAELEDRNPFRTVGILCVLRNEGKYSDEEIATKLRFDSVEDMRVRLRGWSLPDWLVGGESKTHPTKQEARKKIARRLRTLGPTKELPPAGNATELLKERLEALLKSANLLKHMDEGLHGRHFVRTNVETAPVFYPRERFSKEEWKTVCEQHELDPEDKGVWYTDALVKLPGGAALSPSEIEATLIGVYALSGGRMDLLLDALHPDSPSVKADTREGARLCVEGSRADGDTRDGLKVLAQQLATWVRGSEVGPGRPAVLSEIDHGVACRITKYRKDGLPDEEIVRKLSRYKKEDGTSYTIEDVAELGNLGLSWS